jgi:hypothetical protein
MSSHCQIVSINDGVRIAKIAFIAKVKKDRSNSFVKINQDRGSGSIHYPGISGWDDLLDSPLVNPCPHI